MSPLTTLPSPPLSRVPSGMPSASCASDPFGLAPFLSCGALHAARFAVYAGMLLYTLL